MGIRIREHREGNVDLVCVEKQRARFGLPPQDYWIIDIRDAETNKVLVSRMSEDRFDALAVFNEIKAGLESLKTMWVCYT